MKRQPSERYKIFSNNQSYKGSISKMYKVMQLDINPIQSHNGKKTPKDFSPRNTCSCARSIIIIANYQKNANQNYNEISPHVCQKGRHQQVYKQYTLERVWCGEKRTLLNCSWQCTLVQPLWKPLKRCSDIKIRATI